MNLAAPAAVTNWQFNDVSPLYSWRSSCCDLSRPMKGTINEGAQHGGICLLDSEFALPWSSSPDNIKDVNFLWHSSDYYFHGREEEVLFVFLSGGCCMTLLLNLIFSFITLI